MERAVLTRRKRELYLALAGSLNLAVATLQHTHALNLMLRPALLRSTRSLHQACLYNSRVHVRTFRLNPVRHFPRIPRPDAQDLQLGSDKRQTTFIEELAKEDLSQRSKALGSGKHDDTAPRSGSFRAEVIKEDPSFEQPKFQDGIEPPKIWKHVAVSYISQISSCIIFDDISDRHEDSLRQ